MGQSVPLTLATVHKLISLQQNDFINYVVCPSCDSIYEYQDCLQVGANGQQISKECSHVDFPNHPQASRRKPCGTKLLKQVRTKRGSVLTPIKVYPYKPLKKPIEQLVERILLRNVSNGGHEKCQMDSFVTYMMEKYGRCSILIMG